MFNKKEYIKIVLVVRRIGQPHKTKASSLSTVHLYLHNFSDMGEIHVYKGLGVGTKDLIKKTEQNFCRWILYYYGIGRYSVVMKKTGKKTKGFERFWRGTILKDRFRRDTADEDDWASEGKQYTLISRYFEVLRAGTWHSL